MRKVLMVAAVAASSLLMGVGSAQAGEPAVPPAFSPPAPAPVTNVATAETFAKGYAADNAARFIGVNRGRTRVIDANARCLQSPVVDTRFGCVFTLRALVIQRRHNWRDWSHGHSSRARTSGGDRDHGRRRVRIRNYGCLGFLRINGGPTATPSAQVINVECARVPRGDLVAPEPV